MALWHKLSVGVKDLRWGDAEFEVEGVKNISGVCFRLLEWYLSGTSQLRFDGLLLPTLAHGGQGLPLVSTWPWQAF